MAKKILTDSALLVACRLRELREKNYDTAKSAAIAYGASASQWANWETATSEPFDSTIRKFADFFKVPVEHFTKEPENWDILKKEFLVKLQKRARKNKHRYLLATPPTSAATPQESQAGNTATKTGESVDELFMDIASRVTQAHKLMKNGDIDPNVYKTKMEFLADLLELVSKHP